MKFGFGIVGIPKRGGGPLVKPSPSARIDPQHWAAQGLVGAYAFGGDVLNRVNNVRATKTGCEYAHDGIIVGGSDSNHVSTTDSRFNFTSAHTIVFDITDLEATPGVWQVFLSRGLYQADGYYVQRSNNTRRLTWATNSPSQRLQTTDGDFYTQYESVTGALVTPDTLTRSIYRNGKLFYGPTTFAEPTASSSRTLYVGRYDATKLDWYCKIKYLWFYSRALNPSEIARLHAEPYCMFYLPGARRIFLPLTRRIQSYRDYVSISKYNLNGDKIILRKYDPTKSNDMIVLR